MRTPAQAIAYAKTTTSDWKGHCLGFVSAAYAVTGTGPDASTAWAATKVRGTGAAPYGALVWWTGGSKGYGHVAISNGDGRCWTSDFSSSGYVGDGKIRLADIASISKNTPILVYKGWSRDLGGRIVCPVVARTIWVYHGATTLPTYRTNGGGDFEQACSDAAVDIAAALFRGFKDIKVHVVDR